MALAGAAAAAWVLLAAGPARCTRRRSSRWSRSRSRFHGGSRRVSRPGDLAPGRARGTARGSARPGSDDPRRIDLETLEAGGRTAAGGVATPRTRHSHAPRSPVPVSTRPISGVDHLCATTIPRCVRRCSINSRAHRWRHCCGEFRAAIAIEDDDRALALGIKALTLAGDDGGIERAKTAAGLSRDVDEHRAQRTRDSVSAKARAAARSTPHRASRCYWRADPAWAVATIRARRAELSDDALDTLLRGMPCREIPARRAGAFATIVRVGPERTLPEPRDRPRSRRDRRPRRARREFDTIGAAAIARALGYGGLCRLRMTRHASRARSQVHRTASVADRTASSTIAIPRSPTRPCARRSPSRGWRRRFPPIGSRPLTMPHSPRSRRTSTSAMRSLPARLRRLRRVVRVVRAASSRSRRVAMRRARVLRGHPPSKPPPPVAISAPVEAATARHLYVVAPTPIAVAPSMSCKQLQDAS